MEKHSCISPMGLALSLLMSAMVAAQPSASTLPAQGKGAPEAPTSVTVNPTMKVGTASTATASGYSDPDGDPFANWQYEWRSGANGTGALLGSGVSYTPADTNPVYVRVRAQAVRGYPAVQQVGAWREMVYTPVTACTQSMVASGGLTYTCPLTLTEANAKGAAYASYFTENGSNGPAGQVHILQRWSQASTYCNNLGNGYRLPSQDELSALYSARGNMYSTAGWPTSYNYWSSTVYSAGSHNLVNLSSGSVSNYDDGGIAYVSCVRSG